MDTEWIFQLIYADDLRIQAHGPNRTLLILLCYMIWEMCGAPFSWKKFHGGLCCDWIGYYLDYCKFQIGINESRSLWLQEWILRILTDGTVLISRLATGLGRLGYTAGVLEWARPFLSPIYAWCAAAPPSAILPVPTMIKLTLIWIGKQLKEGNRMSDCTLPTKDYGELFRTDAKGELDYIVLGGWECKDGIPPSEARWFSLRVTKDEAPWLFDRGHGSRTIASSELLGTLVAVFLFCTGPDFKPGKGRMSCTGATDNQGNSFVVQRLMTTKYPLAPILMELTSLLASKGLWLDLAWCPREENTLADQLTNSDFTSFSLSNRMPFAWADLPSAIMSDLLEAGQSYMAEMELRKSDKKRNGGPSTRPYRKRKKVRTEWASGFL
jgi:hypothetical protein